MHRTLELNQLNNIYTRAFPTCQNAMKNKSNQDIVNEIFFLLHYEYVSGHVISFLTGYIVKGI